MLPALEGADPIATYAGLRPAGRDGANYLIGPSAACPGLVNVAAIRSTGLSASLGIGEYVAGLVGELGIGLEPERDLPPVPAPTDERPWWRRTAQYRGAAT
jgi:glycerol-3-phosphate dehydrogenase